MGGERTESKIKVLIVDDDSELTDALSEYLSELGFIELSGAVHDGKSAGTSIRSLCPDIVLLDLVMPGLDGFGVLEEVGGMPEGKKPIVIVMSAMGSERIARIAVDLGADYFVYKPFDPGNLVRVMRCLYRQRHPEARAAGGSLAKDFYLHRIKTELDKIGVPPHLTGYKYLITAARIILDNPAALNSLHEKVYLRISSEFKTSPSCVERNIRNAVESAFNGDNSRALRILFASCLSGNKDKPSNSAFLNVFINMVRARTYV
jgi:two-component system response regulator (stage 0 sporulation protein A)